MWSSYHALLLLLCFLIQEPSQAIKQSYIVYLGAHSFGENPSSVDVESVTNFHYDFLGSYIGSTEKAKDAIFYSYKRYFNGFAAILDEEIAARIAEHPNVVSVFLNKRRKLLTTHSWDFLGLKSNGEIPKDSIWNKGFGEDIIIANLDTGVWPESKSFSDEGMGPIPTRWRGICQTDDKNSDNFHCNRKLIGARYFYKGYEAGSGSENVSFNSARDYNGHGSHTLSIAGGNFVAGASVFGNGNGTASGGSPKARVATYKVCWTKGCYDSDIMAGFEAAITDGVDVLSLSIGGIKSKEYFKGVGSIASFHAIANGLVVVSGAGNGGPTPATVVNSEPWVITVAASTIDREFINSVTLGDMKTFKEFSSYHNVSAQDALNCEDGALDPKKTKGKILVCRSGVPDQTEVVGVVYPSIIREETVQAEPLPFPGSSVNFTDSNYILTYINHTKFPMAHISRVETKLGIKSSPVMASFSGRGPSSIEPRILKPDITAPGVNIIAAFSEAISPIESIYDKRKTPFNALSGTSMSTPHVSGLVGLLKALHPDWSSATIKSAIMTTATMIDNTGRPILDYSSLEEATPFAYGAGHIQPNRAADPGLVYDLNITDYLNFLCGHGYNSSMIKLLYGKPYICPKSFNLEDFNYPSITILHLDLGHSLNVTRILTNVGSPSTYTVHIEAPSEVIVSVKPNILIFKEKGEKKEFIITLSLREIIKNKAEYSFGSLNWTDGMHNVRSPIVIKHPHQ